jgi:hypothetical protein
MGWTEGKAPDQGCHRRHVLSSSGVLQRGLHFHISWTPATPGWVLLEAWVLAPVNWTNSINVTTNPIFAPATLPAKPYRLFKP